MSACVYACVSVCVTVCVCDSVYACVRECETVCECVCVCVVGRALRIFHSTSLSPALLCPFLSFKLSPLPSNLSASPHTPLVLRGKQDQTKKQSRAAFSSPLGCPSPPGSVSPLRLRLAGPEAAEVRGKRGPFREPRAPRGPQTPAQAGGTVAAAALGTLPSYRNTRR